MFSAQLFPFYGLAVLKKPKELLGVYGKFTIIVTGIPFDRRWSIMAIETKEITFEQEIEYSLLDHGGYIKVQIQGISPTIPPMMADMTAIRHSRRESFLSAFFASFLLVK